MENVCERFNTLNINTYNLEVKDWSFEKSRLNNFKNIKKFESNDVNFLKEQCVKLQCTYPRFQ